MSGEGPFVLQKRAKRYAFLLFPIIVCAIWIPFGFKTTGILEEWLYLPRGDVGWQILFQPTGGLHYLRPLVDMPHYFAALLTPGSFIGYNVIMVALIAAKGIVLYAIISELTGKTLFAFVAAALFMIYPSDTALFSLRMIAVHTTVLAYLLAVWLLVKSLSVSRKRTLVLIFAAIAALHALNLLIYEVSYPLIFVTPLLLVWREGSINRRVVVRAVAWYLIPLLTFIRFIVLLIFSPEMTFQRVLLEQAENAGTPRGEIILRQLEQLFTRNTYLGWLRTAQSIPDSAPELLIISVSLGIIAGMLCWLLWKPIDRVSPRVALHWAAAGMAIIVLGFVTYIPAGYITTDRVYFFSSIGAGIFTSALLQLLVWWMPLRRLTTALLVGLLVGLGVTAGLVQHRDYVDRSMDQQRIIAGIAAQAPMISEVEAILIIDESETLYGGVFWDRQRIQNALRVLYEDRQLTVYFCTPYSSRANTFRRNELCEPGSDSVLLSPDYPNEAPTSVSYRHVLAFVYQADGSLTLLEKFPSQYVLGQASTDYQPGQLVCAECDPPRRVYTLLSEWPLPDMALPAPEAIETVEPVSHLEEDFLRFPPGVGWSEAQYTADRVRYRWTMNPIATYEVMLRPGTYQVRFTLIAAATDEIREALQFSANGEFESLREADTGIFEADFTVEAGHQEATVLAFHTDKVVSNTSYYQPLGVAIANFVVMSR